MKIFLDLNCLADWKKSYIEMFNDPMFEGFNDNWKDFVLSGALTKLDWTDDGKDLLEFVRSFGEPIEIITSTGGEAFNMDVITQRRFWLDKNNVNLPTNFILSKQFKKDFSTRGTILLDVDPISVEQFDQGEGEGIHHTNIYDTIDYLNSSVLFYRRYKDVQGKGYAM